MVIPNIIDPSVPIGKDDSENVEIERFGEPVVPDFEVPYHTEIMERFNGIDLDSCKKGCRKWISIILWEILQDFIQQLFHMQETL